jgi:hypothetical protein
VSRIAVYPLWQLETHLAILSEALAVKVTSNRLSPVNSECVYRPMVQRTLVDDYRASHSLTRSQEDCDVFNTGISMLNVSMQSVGGGGGAYHPLRGPSEYANSMLPRRTREATLW